MPDEQPQAAQHALFPGTFDPVTLGHLDVLERAAAIFPRVSVGVALNPEKSSLFTVEERAALLEEATADFAGVSVTMVEGLVVQACRALGARIIVRGVRSGTDFDYEVQMARTNRALEPSVDTLLIAPSPVYAHVSSTLVRQIARMGGELSSLVPACAVRALERHFA